MKISYNWLKEFIRLDESPEEIGKRLTGTGLEVEGIEKIESIKGGLEGIVIGEVLTCEKHPDADKLSITRVDIGGEAPSQIVCGAPNVAAGQKVIVATVGATLYPNAGESFQIKKAKIRGVASEGMICAEDEIGLGTSHAGIMVLDTDLLNGTPAAQYFQLNPDYIFEIGLTPNRADAASHYGVARDLKAVLQLEIRNEELGMSPNLKSQIPNPKSQIGIFIENTDACPRFCGVELAGIEVKESPEWLKKRLQSIGLNPINNIVDITNYVCHGFGQPMHAFDADEIWGDKIIVRVPEKDTPFTTLDKTERKLSGFDLMVCNAQEPMAIAGVFGGVKSGIKESTKRVFLEVAYFNPAWVRKTAQFHGLKTDASFRYERGTDPNMPPVAIRLAAQLVQDLAGGSIVGDFQDVYPNPIADLEIEVKHQNINRLIGKNLDNRLIKNILESLDIRVLSDDGKNLKVAVPPYRVDVTREADVIEEILRIYGFDNIELSENLRSDFISNFPEVDVNTLQAKTSQFLASNGFNEIMSLSLTKPAYHQAIKTSLVGEEIPMLNALSEDLAVLRQTMLFSGLESLAYNINRRQKDLKFFEFGRTYDKIVRSEELGIGNEPQTIAPSNHHYKEQRHLALWLTGNKQAETWVVKSEALSFYDLATQVQAVLKSLKVKKFEVQETESELFNYGLTYIVNKKPVASLGQVKPSLSKMADVKQNVFYADFDWDYLTKQYSDKYVYQEVPKFPEVRRDLSLVIDKTLRFEQIRQLAVRTEKHLLQSVNVFDIFEGESLGEGKKSYSVSFILQDKEKTLTDEVIDRSMQRLIAVYEKELGAVIRK